MQLRLQSESIRRPFIRVRGVKKYKVHYEREKTENSLLEQNIISFPFCNTRKPESTKRGQN